MAHASARLKYFGMRVLRFLAFPLLSSFSWWVNVLFCQILLRNLNTFSLLSLGWRVSVISSSA